MQRRRFIVKAGGALVAAAAAAVVDAPNVIAQPKVQWRMSTAWAPALDRLQRSGAAVREGRRGDERRTVPDRGLPGRPDHAAVRLLRRRLQGHHRGVHGRRRSTGPRRSPRSSGSTTVPFGMNPEGMAAWLLPGRRAEALEETYAAFNLVPRPAPAAAPQMAGWFRKKITHDRRLPGASRCASAGLSAARSTPERAPLRSSCPPPRSTPRSSGASSTPPNGSGRMTTCSWASTRPHGTTTTPAGTSPVPRTSSASTRRPTTALPVDLRRTLDHAAAAIQVYGLTDLPREERHRARAAQDGVQGQGRGASDSRCRCCVI